MSATTIAFDCSSLNYSRMSGLNRYVGELYKELQNNHKLIIYASLCAKENQKNVIPVTSYFGHESALAHVSRISWKQAVLPFSLIKNKVNIYYSPIAEGMLFPVCKQVITIHDLIPYIFPDEHPRLRHYYTHILPRIIRSSSTIISISETTKNDIERLYGIGDVPIVTIHQGYNSNIFLELPIQKTQTTIGKYSLNKFILGVLDSRPTKNLSRLIDAFACIHNLEDPSLQLVIVGNVHNKIELLENSDKLGLNNKLIFLGTIADYELAHLYNRAELFVFPSLYEGFGIPPLEAMACGCPTLVSNTSSLPEVCGNASYYVNPYNIDDIATGIHKMLSSSSIKHIFKSLGLERVKKFKYTQTAKETMEVINTMGA